MILSIKESYLVPKLRKSLPNEFHVHVTAGRVIAEFTRTRPLAAVLLRGQFDEATAQEILASTSTQTLCLMDTSVSVNKVKDTRHVCLT